MTDREKTPDRALLAVSIVVVAYSFALAGLAWFDLLPDALAIPALWSLPVLWACLLLGATAVFVRSWQPVQSAGVVLAHELKLLVRTILFAAVGGLMVGLALQAFLNEALVLCRDVFLGGAYNPACRPWRFIDSLLPWILGGISLLVVLALQQAAARDLTHSP
ncbi:MAG TPA: hypothetical protein VJA46_08740 [Acidimicrobiia bacterium]|nr:hypothetical protein [Acidimicrobiia bacterium]